MKPYDFKWTRFYESNADFTYAGLQLNLAEHELIICSTIIDENNFSILTTRRLLTNEEGQLSNKGIQNATGKPYGNFKAYRDKAFTFGQIQLEDGAELRYFIETGNASMVMIHGVRTVIRTTQMTTEQVEKVTRIWNK